MTANGLCRNEEHSLDTSNLCACVSSMFAHRNMNNVNASSVESSGIGTKIRGLFSYFVPTLMSSERLVNNVLP